MPGGRLEVNDGEQCLTTLIKFVRNEFSLQRLQRMGTLNGKHFRDMNVEQQEKVLDALLRSILIDKRSLRTRFQLDDTTAPESP